MRSWIVSTLILLAGTPAHSQWTTDGLLIATGPRAQLDPAIAQDGFGGAVIAWSDWRDRNSDIYAQRVNAHGIPQWSSNGVPVSVSTGHQNDPVIFSDPSGGAILAWHDHRNGNYDIYVQRLNPLGNPLWTFNGVLLCTADGDQFHPTIASDGNAGVIVAWYDSRNGAYDIYAQRVNFWGGLEWPVDGVAISLAPGIQERPGVVSDGEGGAIIAWSDKRGGSWPDIYAQRINGSGLTQWTTDGVAVCTAANSQDRLGMVSDGLGGAIIAWRDLRAGAGDIYAQRIDGSGVRQWELNGVAACAAPNAQDMPVILGDGGGAVIAWYDGRNADTDVYCQRLTVDGLPVWTTDGIPVLVGLGEQSTPAIVSDGGAGVIVAWQDYRDAECDLYAQRIDAAGSSQWDGNAVPVCTAPTSQHNPVMVSDGVGGAILAWADPRTGNNTDVYAWRIGPDGSPTGVNDRSGSSPLVLSHNSPNPFGSSTSIYIELSAGADVEIGVYDVTGRKVRMLLKGYVTGKRRLDFDGMDETGRLLPSGVYFCRVVTSIETVTQKLVIAR